MPNLSVRYITFKEVEVLEWLHIKL
jgi:hypothetical protein